ncbi:M48 family metallopeptidase [candidate division KSB1 bacterium]|nr:M48 family metallopeptidase [candidate division KSB1 bacterium]NIR70485.1 M48 family metallopeptidase [candidate division KSB1 bacterium]NIS23124.1 M48 family metallopeptidase [candidate division KSB1 bacterium]NIT69992.1 M48 family metallopeptidase [candidate division KSB1 bacterium]NIU23618.1 M48 family metallopeptidase [candidate division KSB1 bacterium]
MPEIQYGNKTITFELSFAERKTLEIAVLPDQTVFVKAPNGKPLDKVLQRVQNRARWILKQQAYFASFPNSEPSKEYVSGETFRYLGKQYLLKVIALNSDLNGELSGKECVKMIGGTIRVYTKAKDFPHVKDLMDRWYRAHAERKFAKRIDICSQMMQKYGIKRPPVEIRVMKNRWGSFTSSGKVLLNPRLIEWPTYCIDYVILHELCHLKYPHHSKAFYQLLNTVLPEWREIKSRLEMSV